MIPMNRGESMGEKEMEIEEEKKWSNQFRPHVNLIIIDCGMHKWQTERLKRFMHRILPWQSKMCVCCDYFFYGICKLAGPKQKRTFMRDHLVNSGALFEPKKKKNARARTQAHMRKPHRRLRNRLIIYLLVESLQTSHSLFVIILLLFFWSCFFAVLREKKHW